MQDCRPFGCRVLVGMAGMSFTDAVGLMLHTAFFSSYKYVCHKLEGCVYDDVYQYNKVAPQFRAHGSVDYYERYGQNQYGHKSLVLCHSGTHQLVMP